MGDLFVSWLMTKRKTSFPEESIIFINHLEACEYRGKALRSSIASKHHSF